MAVDYTASAAFNSDNFLIGFAVTGTQTFAWDLFSSYLANDVWDIGTGTELDTTDVTVATNANATTSSVSSTITLDISSAPVAMQVTLAPRELTAVAAPLDLDTSGGDPGNGSADIDWQIHPDSVTATATIDYADLHYWVPPAPVYPQPVAVEGGVSVLRLTQRNDGFGVRPSPRLGARQASGSRDNSRAPRVGRKNTYF